MGLLARLGLRAPEQTTPATPPAGQRALYAKTGGWYDLNSAGVETALGGGGAPIPANYLVPTGASYETFPRNSNYLQGTGGTTNGTLFLVAIALPVGLSVGRLAFVSATSGAGTPTHWWFGLYDQSRVQLATTADQTTTAWAANTVKSATIATTAVGAATTFVTTYTGLYYLGFLMTANTMPSLVSGLTTTSLTGAAPILSGASSTAQIAPPAFPFTAAAITPATTIPYAYVGP